LTFKPFRVPVVVLFAYLENIWVGNLTIDIILLQAVEDGLKDSIIGRTNKK